MIAGDVLIYTDPNAEFYLTGRGLRVVGEVDLVSRPAWAGVLAAASRSLGNGQLRVDLSEVTFLDTAGVWELIACAARIAPVEVVVQLTGPSIIRRLGALCGSDQVQSLIWRDEQR